MQEYLISLNPMRIYQLREADLFLADVQVTSKLLKQSSKNRLYIHKAQY